MIDQGELFSISSPCQGICEVNNRGYCKGCLRNRTERFHWLEFTAFQQQLIINNCEKRRQKIIAARNVIDTEEAEIEIPQFDLFEAATPPNNQPTEQAANLKNMPEPLALAAIPDTDDITQEETPNNTSRNSLFETPLILEESKESKTVPNKQVEKSAKSQPKNTNQPPDSDQLDMFS